MEGRLNNKGLFEIKRANGWVPQECPFNGGGPCGSWCPQFTEPFMQRNTKFGGRDETVLHICHGKHWKFLSFEDRRDLTGA